MRFAEQQAREIILVEAIESSPTFKIFADQDRISTIENAVLKTLAQTEENRSSRFLIDRAKSILTEASKSDVFQSITALREKSSWHRWLFFAIPAIALTLGLLSDQIANPRRVDLLSLPLLGVLAWNFVMYALLGMSVVVSLGKSRPVRVPFKEIQHFFQNFSNRWSLAPDEELKVTGAFLREWRVVASEITGHRLRIILHCAAAAWACGIILSILLRGLTVEYRAGWESTFLTAEQVHRLLNTLFYPVYELFGTTKFSQAEILNLRFDSPLHNVEAGARWAWLYTGLLVMVVVIPRLLLATISVIKTRQLARGLTVDTSRPYFARLMRTVVPVHCDIQLLVAPSNPTCAAIYRVLLSHANPPTREEKAPALISRCLISGEYGDKISITQISEEGASTQSRLTESWLSNVANISLSFWKRATLTERVTFGRHDLVIAAVTDMETLSAAIEHHRRASAPLLLVTDIPLGGSVVQREIRSAVERFSFQNPNAVKIVELGDFAACWIKETRLFDAILHLLPNAEAGVKRLTSSWKNSNYEGLQRAMNAVAEYLVSAGSLAEEILAPKPAFLFAEKVHRRNYENALSAARDKLLARADHLSILATETLFELYQINEIDRKELIESPAGEFFRGLAGRPSGQQLDLVGGVVTDVNSWVENAGQLHFSDNLMLAISENILLRYLAVIHFGRRCAGTPAFSELKASWKAHVHSKLESSKDGLSNVWSAQRDGSKFAKQILGTNHTSFILNSDMRSCLMALHISVNAEKSYLEKFLPEFVRNALS